MNTESKTGMPTHAQVISTELLAIALAKRFVKAKLGAGFVVNACDCGARSLVLDMTEAEGPEVFIIRIARKFATKNRLRFLTAPAPCDRCGKAADEGMRHTMKFGKHGLEENRLDTAPAQLRREERSLPYELTIKIQTEADLKALGLSSDAFKQFAQTGTQANQKVAQESQRAAQQVSESYNRLITNVKSFGAALGVVGGLSGIVGFTRSLINLGDQLSDLSEQTGISVKTLAGLRVIAAQTGTSIEAVAQGSRLMMRALAEGADQTGRQAAALQRLGISSNDVLRSMSDPEGFLQKFAERLGKIPTQAERTALAFEIAGRSGGQLIPVLLNIAKNGLPGVSDETARAYEMMGRLKDRTVELTAKFTDWIVLGIDKARQNLKALGDQLAPFLATDFQKLMRGAMIGAEAAAGITQTVSPPKLPVNEELLAKQAAALSDVKKQLLAVQIQTVDLWRSQGDLSVSSEVLQIKLVQLEKAALLNAAAHDKTLTPAYREFLSKLTEARIKYIEQTEAAKNATEQAKLENDERQRQILLSQEYQKQTNLEKQVTEKVVEIEKERLSNLQRLESHELDKLRAAGAPEDVILQRQLEALRQARSALENSSLRDTDDSLAQIADIARQTEIAEIQLFKLRNTGIDVAGEVARAVTDITTAVISGTLKWADVGRSVLASFVRVAMEQFTNFLRNMQQVSRSSAALASVGGSMPGGGGQGGGGFLSNIFSMFGGGGSSSGFGAMGSALDAQQAALAAADFSTVSFPCSVAVVAAAGVAF